MGASRHRNRSGLARSAALRDDDQVLRRLNRGRRDLWLERSLDHDADGLDLDRRLHAAERSSCERADRHLSAVSANE